MITEGTNPSVYDFRKAQKTPKLLIQRKLVDFFA
jgi:hypothetical protein